ncbi:MAG: galactokinase family protein [Spirochaetales bacterium]|nr:galactokinase family protein [Spirochaetales bacterium]
MAVVSEIIGEITSAKADNIFLEIYKPEKLEEQKSRYINLLSRHKELFGDVEAMVISAPGRTELGGNHTDHNHGNVLAGSVDFDSVCVISASSNNMVAFVSEGYDSISLDSSDLEVKTEEKDTTDALIRGILFRFTELGYKIGGFNLNMESSVLPGSGLSSSASVEVMIGTALSELFNDGEVGFVEVAQIGQYAENLYFGKACGLMDQVACAAGGVVGIDFKDPAAPVIKPVKVNFSENGYRLMITDVKSSHANLSDEYSAMPIEMKSVANVLGKEVCREISMEEIIANIDKIRKECGDRAVIRAIHFLNENNRAVSQLEALENGDIDTYLKLVNGSGNSSFKYLQNVYVNFMHKDQAVSIALAVTEDFLNSCDPEGPCACRIQGGGFAGTIQAYVPNESMAEYITLMENVFGKASCFELVIRNKPACRVL